MSRPTLSDEGRRAAVRTSTIALADVRRVGSLESPRDIAEQVVAALEALDLVAVVDRVALDAREQEYAELIARAHKLGSEAFVLQTLKSLAAPAAHELLDKIRSGTTEAASPVVAPPPEMPTPPTAMVCRCTQRGCPLPHDRGPR